MAVVGGEKKEHSKSMPQPTTCYVYFGAFLNIDQASHVLNPRIILPSETTMVTPRLGTFRFHAPQESNRHSEAGQVDPFSTVRAF